MIVSCISNFVQRWLRLRNTVKNSQSVSLTRYVVLSVRLSVCLPVPVSFIKAAIHRQSSYDIARLYLTEPTNFWRNSTPFFGAAAFCMTKIGGFRSQLQKWKWMKMTLKIRKIKKVNTPQKEDNREVVPTQKLNKVKHFARNQSISILTCLNEVIINNNVFIVRKY